MAITLNGTGSISGLTSGAGIAATALSGQVPDANAPSGSVIQVVTGSTSTRVQSNSTSYGNLGLSVSITPSNASNIILITVSFNTLTQTSNSWDEGVAMFRLWDGSTVLNETSSSMRSNGSSSNNKVQSDVNIVFSLSAGSTSARTYSVQGKVPNTGYFFNAFPDAANVPTSGDSNYQMNNIGWITVMEIAA